MNIAFLTAPSAWASYLVNGDGSGLEKRERRSIDAWLRAEGVAHVLYCEPHGFSAHHDAVRFMPLAADCECYSVVNRPIHLTNL